MLPAGGRFHQPEQPTPELYAMVTIAMTTGGTRRRAGSQPHAGTARPLFSAPKSYANVISGGVRSAFTVTMRGNRRGGGARA